MNRSGPNPFAASARVLGVYIRASLIIFAIQFALYCAGFAAAQIPAWGLMALTCALFGLIPRIGSLLGIGLVLLLAGLGGANALHLGMAGGVWVAVQAVEGFWLTPRLIGKPLGLRPMAVFIVLLLGSFAFGPLGLLLAVPVLAVALVWIRYFRGSKQQALPADPPPYVQTHLPPITENDPNTDK